MPIESIIVKGIANSATVNFINFVPNTTPSWKIYTFDGKLVVSGNGNLIGGIWTANFTIPNSAPNTTPNQRYTIVWQGTNTVKTVQSQENFSVTDGLVAPATDAAVVVLENSQFDIVFNSTLPTLTNASLRVVYGNITSELWSQSVTNITGVATTNGYAYKFTVPGNVAKTFSNGVLPAFAVINYLGNNSEQIVEVQPIYIANLQTISIMNSVRRMVDRLREKNIIPQLRITEIDLLHFVMEGINKVNAAPNTNVSVSLGSNIPNALLHYVIKASQIELLRAQYFGEGMAAFDFQGMAVSLTSDRTQYIQGLITELTADMQDLKEVKIALAKSGYSGSGYSVGTIGTFLGPLRNYGGVTNSSAFGGFNSSAPILSFWI